MRLGTLDQQNGHYDSDRWTELDALAKGGKAFKALLSRFLPQNPVEPGEVYTQRRAQAHYRSYMGSIINLYTGWLFAAGFSPKAYKRGTEQPVTDLAQFYGEFQENVGCEMQLSNFVKERFREALTKHRSHWLVEFPSNDGVAPETAADYEARGLGRATLKPIAPEELYDWKEDDEGNLLYAVVHTCYEERKSWRDPRNTVVETWRIYEPDLVYTFQLEYEPGQRPDDAEYDVPQVGEPVPHGFKRVPIVTLHLPKEICIGEQTRDTQLEHFRLDNALSWLTRRTCYAQPVFNLEDAEGNPPRMGAGYAVILGKEDKMGWSAPPIAPFDVLQKNVDNKREEIYRLVHQMAQAVDNNAETVGRSADSKEIDAAATRIMLNEYGKFVSETIEETYEIISEARGEVGYEWSVEGFTGYDTATVASLIAASKEARELGIPSETFQKEVCTKAALAMLPEVDQRVKDKIRTEIFAAKIPAPSTVLVAAQADDLTSKSELNRAKAEAEPIKAKAALDKAKQPPPSSQPSDLARPAAGS